MVCESVCPLNLLRDGLQMDVSSITGHCNHIVQPRPGKMVWFRMSWKMHMFCGSFRSLKYHWMLQKAIISYSSPTISRDARPYSGGEPPKSAHQRIIRGKILTKFIVHIMWWITQRMIWKQRSESEEMRYQQGRQNKRKKNKTKNKSLNNGSILDFPIA